MLVVDTPFPPYAPREYVFGGMPDKPVKELEWSDEPETGLGDAEIEKLTERNFSMWLTNGEQSRTDGKPSYISWDSAGNITGLDWFQAGGMMHRDGDLPSSFRLSPPSTSTYFFEAAFFKKRMCHRIFDYADLSESADGVVEGKFFLYNQWFSEYEFFSIHADAIRFNIPLWCAFAKNMFDLNFDKVAAGDLALLTELPVEWAAKVLGLQFVGANLEIVETSMSYSYSGESCQEIYSILPLIKYEQDVARSLVT